MSNDQINMCWTFLIGLAVGAFIILAGNSIHYRIGSQMDYGDGQVLMLLLDTYPDLTSDARDSLIICLNDGYVSQWEYDFILRKATKAVFYQGAKNPC